MIDWITSTIFGKALTTFCISMVPLIELRLGLPYGLASGLNYPVALMAAVLGNMLPVPFIVFFIEAIFKWMRTKIPKLDGLVTKMEKKADNKKETVEKYGYIGLILLVAIPLPGTGAWTGSLVAALMRLEKKKSIPCVFIGILIAALIITIVYFGFDYLI